MTENDKTNLNHVSQLLKGVSRSRDLDHVLKESLGIFQNNKIIVQSIWYRPYHFEYLKECQGITVTDKQFWPKEENCICRHVCDKYQTNILVLKASKDPIWSIGPDYQNVESFFKAAKSCERVQIIRLTYVNLIIGGTGLV